MSILEEIPEIPEGCLSRRCNVRSLYLRETLQREELERELEKVTVENEIYKKAVALLLSSIKDLLKPDHVALNLLKERLLPIIEVSSLHYFVVDGVINLWIITREENYEAEMKIAESLADLFSLFRNLRFDFMIIPKYDLRLEEVLPSESITVFSK